MEDAGIYAALRRGSSGSAGLGAGGKKEGLGDGFPRGFFERVPGGETLGELRGRLPDVPAFGLPAALPSLPAWGGARAVPPAAAPAAAKAVKADPARKRSGGRKAAKKVKDPYVRGFLSLAPAPARLRRERVADGAVGGGPPEPPTLPARLHWPN
jgi:hypothetical protein